MAPFILPAQHNNNSEINYYNDLYTTDGNELPTLSSLSRSKAYTNYLPILTIILSSIYLSTFLLRYVWNKVRKYRNRKRQQEKQQWKLVWKKSITKCQFKDTLLFDNDSTYQIASPLSTYDGHSSASSLTLNSQSCRSDASVITFISEPNTRIRDCNSLEKTGYSCSDIIKSSNCTLCTIDDEHGKNHFSTKILMNPNICLHNEKRDNLNFGADDNILSKFNISRLIRNYWKISRNTRLNLLWNWSVSMGYCEYSHAKQLNDLILRLENNRDISGQNNNETTLQVEKEFLESNTIDQSKKINQVTQNFNKVLYNNVKTERIM